MRDKGPPPAQSTGPGDADWVIVDLARRDPVVIADVVHETRRLALRPGWRSNDSRLPEAGPSHWHFNHSPAVVSGPDLPPPRSGGTARRSVRLAERHPNRAGRVFRQTFDLLRGALGRPDLELRRVYVNAYLVGSDTLVHTDSDHDDEVTCIVPAHHFWNPDFGGGTIIYPHGPQRPGIEVLPEPGRALLFRSHYRHHAAPLARDCPMLRVVLVLKFGCVDPGTRLASLLGEPRPTQPHPRTAPAAPPSFADAMLWLAGAGLEHRSGAGVPLAGFLAAAGFWARSAGAPTDVTRAALCHALGGSTDAPHPALDAIADRVAIEEAFGERAAILGLGFAALDRRVIEPALKLLAHPDGDRQAAATILAAGAPAWFAPRLDEPETLDAIILLELARGLAAARPDALEALLAGIRDHEDG